MSSHIWTPGVAGPLDELVNRISRMAATFARDQGLTQAEVRIELFDGSRYVLQAVMSEPGFGFFSFVPHVEDGGEVRCVVVPIGAVRLIEISPPDTERPFGFTGPE
jgi:hypothetical protein